MMPNGSGLYGASGSFMQAVTCVQKLDDDSAYFLFTSGVYQPPTQIYPPSYSIIDMRLDNKKGDILPGYKNILLPGGQRGWNAIVGTRARNNRDAWIVIRLMDMDSNYFAAYRITVAGIDPVPVLSPSILQTPKPAVNWYPITEEIKISPDGTKLYCLYQTDTLEICNFNAETGVVSPLFTIKPKYSTQVINNCTSIEFSINSKLLYLTGFTSSYQIFQYNAEMTDSAAFTQSILQIGTIGHHSAMQMAPDGKIYDTKDMLDSLWVINNPSVLGSGCGFVKDGFCLQNFSHADGLPQFVQRYKAYIHYTGNCGNPFISFTSDIWPPADTIQWSFGDGTYNAGDPNPTHMYTSAGTFTVELYVRHNDNRTDTSWCVLHILNSLHPDLGPDRTVCTGTSTTFDAGACSGCTFQWINLGTGLPVGSNQTLTTSQAGTYILHETDPLGCTGTDTVQLLNIAPPSVTNNPLSKTICSGESTNIILTADNPSATFSWTATLITGSISGFSPDSGLIINQVLLNNSVASGSVNYHITPKVAGCLGTPVDFPVTVNAGDSVKVSISASANNICQGTAVTFIATPTNGGSNPGYQWLVNGMNVSQYAPTMVYTPANGDIVTCILTSSNTVCISNNPATSNAIMMVVNPLNPVSVSISPSANPFCQGSQVTFTATPLNGGSNPLYQWFINGVGGIVQTIPSMTYIPANGDIVHCILTSNVACPSGNPATSNSITMVENTVNPVSIVITTPLTTVCSGTSVTLTAATMNGGPTPSFQWKVNGVNTGPNNQVFIHTPINGDCISCVLMSNLVCASGNPATSNSICMTVNPNLPVSLTISVPSNIVCAGSQVTATATAINGGSTPVYQWQVDGVNVGTNSNTYTFIPAFSIQLSCILNSSALCASNNPATSNTITMTVNANMPVSILIFASNNPVCSGIPVTFMATAINGGTAPIFQWYFNGISVGTNSLNYTCTPANGDQLKCILTSNLTCISGNPATSNTITMGVAASPIVTLTRCNDSITTTVAQPFRLKGGIPLGGTYSGSGVTNGIFYPAIAGVGTHQITYTYTNAALCSASAIVTIVTRNALPLTCGNPLTDIRDNKVYPTVQIGTQCWMADNLDFGTEIPETISQRDNCIAEKYSSHLSPLTSHSFYQWDEMMQYDETISTQGFCPPGWHLPSESDWITLFANWNGNAFAAWPLLSTGYSGFNALLSGTQHLNKTWDWNGFATFFWSSTAFGATKAWSHGMNDSDPSVSLYPALRSNAFSVRCLKD